MIRKDRWCLLLYLTLAIATGFADLRMRAYPQHAATKFIPAVVDNTESAPGRYRVLAPFIDHQIVQVTGAAPQNVWYVTRLLWIFFGYSVLHLYLRTWFAPGPAVAGVAIVAASLPLTFTNSWAHPDHLPELALFSLGAMAVARGADGLFAIALAAAAVNRETSVFLVLLFLVAEPLSRLRLVRGVLFALEWAAIYAGLRAIRGLSHYDYWQAARNLADLQIPLPDAYDPYYRVYAYFVVALFGPMLVLAVRARHAPPFMRRALLVVPCVVIVAFLFSNIIETRIFTPLYPLVLPALVYALFAPGASEPERVRSDSGPEVH